MKFVSEVRFFGTSGESPRCSAPSPSPSKRESNKFPFEWRHTKCGMKIVCWHFDNLCWILLIGLSFHSIFSLPIWLCQHYQPSYALLAKCAICICVVDTGGGKTTILLYVSFQIKKYLRGYFSAQFRLNGVRPSSNERKVRVTYVESDLLFSLSFFPLKSWNERDFMTHIRWGWCENCFTRNVLEMLEQMEFTN